MSYSILFLGIHIFATGGIGGVHRGAETSMDISADILELGRTPVTVVCAGVKSILDIRKTLEVLETQGTYEKNIDRDKFNQKRLFINFFFFYLFIEFS